MPTLRAIEAMVNAKITKYNKHIAKMENKIWDIEHNNNPGRPSCDASEEKEHLDDLHYDLDRIKDLGKRFGVIDGELSSSEVSIEQALLALVQHALDQ